MPASTSFRIETIRFSINQDSLITTSRLSHARRLYISLIAGRVILKIPLIVGQIIRSRPTGWRPAPLTLWIKWMIHFIQFKLEIPCSIYEENLFPSDRPSELIEGFINESIFAHSEGLRDALNGEMFSRRLNEQISASRGNQRKVSSPFRLERNLLSFAN